MIIEKSKPVNDIKGVTRVFTEHKVESRQGISISQIPSVIGIISAIQVADRLSRYLRGEAVEVDIGSNVTVKAVSVDFSIDPGKG